MTETTQPSLDLSGHTILITGAGGGLGAATAGALGAAGAEVMLLGRTVKKLEAVYDEIVGRGGPQPAIVPLDLEGASPDDYTDLAERIETQCGRLDGLIHCAALTGPLTPLDQYPPLEWLRVLQINLNAPMLLTQACLPLLRQAPQPRVLFFGEDRAHAYWGAYGVAKSGIDALATILAEEVESTTAIGVHTIRPGPMRTGLRSQAFPGEDPATVPPVDNTVAYILEHFRE